MLERHDHPEAIVELRLARPPANALDQALLEALDAAIVDSLAGGAQGLVLSGAPGLFSAGLDVPSLLQLPGRAELEAAWRSFFAVCARLCACPVPTVAAITGHSPAGGAVLSLYCDYRVMAQGPYRIGLNEVQVGLIVPETIQYALRRLLGAHRAERLLVAGAMIEAGQARDIGLVDALAPVDEVVAQALAWLRGTLALPRSAMLRTRALARADLVAATGDGGSLDLAPFIEAWYGEETQSVLKALVARLRDKPRG
ncbi:MAG: enoyl-CoA hydratase/isomerase family protein [Lysobacteraceae bacterium]